MANEVDPESACVGIEDLISVYVLDRTLCDAVKAHLSNKMGLNPRVFDVISVDEIPKNSAGKILYMELSNRSVSA
jgi:acyl-coenzyme A synthetase/AMP-(fatty) acid ligase